MSDGEKILKHLLVINVSIVSGNQRSLRISDRNDKNMMKMVFATRQSHPGSLLRSAEAGDGCRSKAQTRRGRSTLRLERESRAAVKT